MRELFPSRSITEALNHSPKTPILLIYVQYSNTRSTSPPRRITLFSRPRFHQELQPVLSRDPASPSAQDRVSNSILPIIKPHLLFLHRTPPSRLASWYICIRPDTFDDLVFLCARKHLRHTTEETVHFIGRVDDNSGMREGERDCAVASVGCAVYKRKKATF